MKTKISLLFVLIGLLFSCSVPQYLPPSQQIDVNRYGSHIKLFQKNGKRVSGELIAVDHQSVVVLVESTKNCITVPINQIYRFKLRYARPAHYGWSIPLFTLSTISHGFFLIITAPLNLILTISVTVGGENAFTYSQKDMSYEKLIMFARFPQGIPSNVDLANIR